MVAVSSFVAKGRCFDVNRYYGAGSVVNACYEARFRPAAVIPEQPAAIRSE